MPRFPLIIMFLAALLVLGACTAEAPAAPTAEVETAVEAPMEEAAEGEVHWSYEGEGGPENWGVSVKPEEYAACAQGKEQSPVDIPADAPLNPNDVVYAYEESAVKIENNGHAIQVDYDDGSTAEIGGTPYMLDQFHLHSPSEHTMANKGAAMEMHLVHYDANKNPAVIGVMLVEGEENPAFAPVWDNMAAATDTAMTVDGAAVNVDDLLPADRSYYTYDGSLTTPPCTEGVLWLVLSTPVEISAEQLAAFRKIHDNTNRPTQPMNDRVFNSGLSAAPAASLVDTDVYYQLQTQLTESDNKCLEGQGGEAPGSGAVLDGAGFMDDCQEVTGQSWKFVPEADVDGYYRLQNQIGEENNLCAEGNRLAEESVLGGALVMMPCDDVSGQFWKLADAGDGYYRLQTQFLEAENKCLESQGGAAPGSDAVLEGAAFMNDCQDVTGQLWLLVPQE